LTGSRQLLIAWLGGIVAFGLLGLYDFWRWAYDYGHNIDIEHAIIKVPGMVYQPPLIGTKQLLNFTADSWPAAGTWVALVAFLCGAVALWLGTTRKSRSSTQTIAVALTLAFLAPRRAQAQREIVVAPGSSVTTIAEALRRVESRGRVIVKPGHYREPMI